MKPALINPALERLGTTPLRQGCKLVDLINRPQVTIENMAEHVDAFRRELEKITERKEEIIEAAEILIKYEGTSDANESLPINWPDWKASR